MNVSEKLQLSVSNNASNSTTNTKLIAEKANSKETLRAACFIVSTGLAIILATWVAIKSPFLGVVLGLTSIVFYLNSFK